MNKELLKAALYRALWTFLETAGSMIVIGKPIYSFNWISIAAISATSALVSFIKSITVGMPETAKGKIDGTMYIDASDPEVDKYLLHYDAALEDIKTKKTVTFTVNPNADLSGKKTEE